MKISLVLVVGICLISSVPFVKCFIDWVIWGPLLGTAIAAGVSGGIAGLSGDYVVQTTMWVENWYKGRLWSPVAVPNGGVIANGPFVIEPSKKEKMDAHKVGGTATGTSGSVSWLIGNTGTRLVVMWSVPYSYDFHTNWLAVGFAGNSHKYSWFDNMYRNRVSSSGFGYGAGNLRFIRGQYYYNIQDIVISNNKFVVTASMSTSHKPQIVIKIRPKNENDLAPSLKSRLEQLK